MKILAVDTSTVTGSVALSQDGRVVAEWTLQSGLTHNRRLLKAIDFILRDVKWSLADMDGFAATTGPGSFTGLRIGLTTAKTLAWSLGKPFAGIPSLDALAAPFVWASLPVCTLIDARKNEVYCAVYGSDGQGKLRQAKPYQVAPPLRALRLITEPTIFCGDGWLAYRDLFRQADLPWIVEAPPPFHVIRAGFVAELARRRFIAGDADDPVHSVPLYIRPSEAELKNPHLA